jgi:putative restriction endonuclease
MKAAAMATPEQWLAKLAKLKVDRARGDPAPHKPLLLLVILDLAESGQLPPMPLRLTPDLAFRFCTFWGVVAGRRRQRPDVRYPFYHLKSDGFWAPLGGDGKPAADRRQARSAVMPADFLAIVENPVYREHARRILIASYFPPDERIGLSTLVGLPIPTDEEVVRDANYKAPDEARQRGREGRFRLQVVTAYQYTCALTGYRLTTIDAGSIVDAAHIHQFASSRNNEPQNGIALSKNAHWLFDNGLWSIADDYTVLVATDHFAEECPDQKALREYHGQRIHLPVNASLWPDPAHLDWHRRMRFQGP